MADMKINQYTEEFVKDAIKQYFLDSRANWKVEHQSKPKGEKGYDLELSRKNKVFLVEAKLFKGPFGSAWSSLIGSVLVSQKNQKSSVRPQKRKSKGESWCAYKAFAINNEWYTKTKSSRSGENDIIRNVLEYVSKYPLFYLKYGELLRVTTIFFVRKDKSVAEVKWPKLIQLSKEYSRLPNGIKKRRIFCKKLIESGKIKFKLMRKVRGGCKNDQKNNKKSDSNKNHQKRL